MPTLTVIPEAHVEQAVAEYATSQGCLMLKLNVIGRIGWPDRLFLYQGRVLFVEFKRQGERPRKMQEYIHGLIRRHGFKVAVIDTITQGREQIYELTNNVS